MPNPILHTWNVKFFQTTRGNFPVKDFIENQNLSTVAKIGKSIRFLKSYGPFLKPPYAKKISLNLWELRIHGEVAVRIFYTLFNNEFYLLHSFKKKSQKTPTKEIKTALDRIKELI